jgi:hypothetical protein
MNESAVVDSIMKTFPKAETTTAYGYKMKPARRAADASR